MMSPTAVSFVMTSCRVTAQHQEPNVDYFLDLVRKYTDIQELTTEMIHEFVEKILGYNAERIDGGGYSTLKSYETA